MLRRHSQKNRVRSWITQLIGLAGLLALLSWPVLACGGNYILEVKGNSLQPVLTAYGLNLQRQLFSSPLLTVGVVSIPENAPWNLASTVAQDPSVLRFQQDQHFNAKAPQSPSSSQSVINLQAWQLSTQNAQQKTNSYLTQSALGIVGSPTGNMGTGVTVAVIDTAVDTTHPLLAGQLIQGADCVGSVAMIAGQPNSCSGTVSSIWADPVLQAALAQSTVATLNQSTVIILDQSTVIILDQSTVIILDGNSAAALQGQQLPADFGHGTMVASLIAAAAPNAQIMPIRAFNADGSAQLSDVVAAIYYAVNNGAKVINMSFDLDTADSTLEDAIEFATAQGVICVASAANVSSNALVYPAGFSATDQSVIGVGSVDSQYGLYRSAFSGYGQPSVDVYAPGENLIAAFPGNHFAVVSGTSFAAALASGVAAVVESTKNGSLTVYVNAITYTGAPVLYPYDGTNVVNAKSALTSIP